MLRSVTIVGVVLSSCSAFAGECKTVESKKVYTSQGQLYAMHAVCKPAKCMPDEREGAHWNCPDEGGTPIGAWEYRMSPTESKWRLIGETDWHQIHQR